MSRWLTMALLLVAPVLSSAQLGDLLDRAVRKGTDKVEETADRAVDEAARGPQQEEPEAEQAPAGKGPKAPPEPKRAGGEAPARSGDTAASPATSGQAAPEVYGNRYDFVPGDKVLVHDDFGDTDVGEYPAKWTVKDGGGGNPVEVVQVGSRRFLRSRPQPEGQDASLHWLRYEVKGDLPREFTLEFDFDTAGPLSVVFSDPVAWGGQEVALNANGQGQVATANAQGQLPGTSGIQHVAIAVSGTQLKVYVGGERVLADPDGVTRPIKRVGVQFLQSWQETKDRQMFTALRIAAGGKSAKTMLAGEGRIVTHGILFDTASDVIRPESGPTLREILALLKEDPSLRFSIEGHTDNQGGPKVNGPLSERRAAAVKAWLAGQGVDAGRLTTKGFGDAKPIDSNQTAEGRANNRRVEFVKAGKG